MDQRRSSLPMALLGISNQLVLLATSCTWIALPISLVFHSIGMEPRLGMMTVSYLALRTPLLLRLATPTTSTLTRPDPRFRPMTNLKEASRSTRKSTRTAMLALRNQSLKSLSARAETR